MLSVTLDNASWSDASVEAMMRGNDAVNALLEASLPSSAKVTIRLAEN